MKWKEYGVGRFAAGEGAWKDSGWHHSGRDGCGHYGGTLLSLTEAGGSGRARVLDGVLDPSSSLAAALLHGLTCFLLSASLGPSARVHTRLSCQAGGPHDLRGGIASRLSGILRSARSRGCCLILARAYHCGKQPALEDGHVGYALTVDVSCRVTDIGDHEQC